MTMIRRELPRSSERELATDVGYRIERARILLSDVGRSAHWTRAAQTKPVSSRATAVMTCWFGFPRPASR